MSKYGIPYKGSKGKIAEYLIKKLPSGSRFVDLFGGGFAMTHCAILSGKYKQFLYNDIEPLLGELIQKAISGYYNYSRFTPDFVDRDAFFRKKDKDGYIKYLWSFANNGRNYLFGKDVEPTKKLAHDWVVFGKYNERLNIPKNLRHKLNAKDITTRRLQLKSIVRAMEKRSDLQQLQQLEQLEIAHSSYDDYVYKNGDVVYCDPPYENTDKYGDKVFDSQNFYDWVASRPYIVYFSSYPIDDKRFKLVACKLKTGLMSVQEKRKKKLECLYVNNVKE